MKSTIERFKTGDLRALAQLISAVENQEFSLLSFLSEIHENKSFQAKRIGITGSPGAGKSTLLNSFIKELRREKKRVAVIAIDPVSPFSGGAVLGDRIRWSEHFSDPDVYIRSLSTRGKLGGLSLATREVSLLLSAFGFEYIFIETVGVGQSEVDIRYLADVILLVIVPEWGDGIQMIKSGVTEIADIFAVNKADREGAEGLQNELCSTLAISDRKDTPVLLCHSGDARTQTRVLEAIRTFLTKNLKVIQNRQQAQNQRAAQELIRAQLEKRIMETFEKMKPVENPYEFAHQWLSKLKEGF